MSHKTDVQNLIINHTRRLQKLKELQALKGHDVQPDLLIEIEDVEAQLEELQAELANLANDGEPTPILSTRAKDGIIMSSEEKPKEGRRSINTGGGAYIEGTVNTGGGDFVGRDRITYSGAETIAIITAFDTLYQALTRKPDTLQKEMVKQTVVALEKEAKKGEHADEDKVKQGFEVIVAMLPDIGEVAINTFINPIQGLSTAFQKIAQKAKENLKS